MGDFINTIDELGEEIVMNSIIDRSIEEFKDGIITELGSNAFAYCGALNVLECPNVETIKEYCFSHSSIAKLCFPNLKSVAINSIRDASSLEVVDLLLCTTIGQYAFYNDKKLKTLILRGSALCGLESTTAINGNWSGNKPLISSGTGYIYVPSALIEDYKVATNWATYADQFRVLEDYTVDGTITGELDETKI